MIKNLLLCSILYSSVIASPYPKANTGLSKKVGIIFDCDGVLVDTECLKFLSWQKAFQEHNISLTLEEFLPLVGNPSFYILQKISTLKNIPLDVTINQRRQVVYQNLQSQGVQPITNAIKFVQKLAAQKNDLNISLALASSAPRKEIMVNLQSIGLADVFDVIVSGHDDLAEYHDPDGTNKPKPYIYQKTAQLLGINPSQCVVFEDTNAGVTAAASAGMTAIAVPNTYTQQQDFSQATRIINSFDVITPDEVKNVVPLAEPEWVEVTSQNISTMETFFNQLEQVYVSAFRKPAMACMQKEHSEKYQAMIKSGKTIDQVLKQAWQETLRNVNMTLNKGLGKIPFAIIKNMQNDILGFSIFLPLPQKIVLATMEMMGLIKDIRWIKEDREEAIWNTEAFLQILAVRPDSQGRGLGKKLVFSILSHLHHCTGFQPIKQLVDAMPEQAAFISKTASGNIPYR